MEITPDVQEEASHDFKQNRSAGGQTNPKTEYVKYAITLIAASIFILHLLLPDLKIDSIALSLLLLAMLPWLIPYLQIFLKSGKIFGAEFEFLQKKVDVQEEKIRSQQEVIRLIYEALKRSLTQHEYRHLIDLQPENSSFDYQHSFFLEMEMIRLCQHGYVEETYKDSTWKMKEYGASKFDLKDLYRITNAGKEYLKLLQELQAVISASNARYD